MIKKIISEYRNAFSGLPKNVWMLTLVVFINRSGSIVLFFLALYLTRVMDYSLASAGQMVSIYGLGALIGAYLGGSLSDKIGTNKVQFYSLLFTGFGYIIFSFAETSFQIGVLLFIIAIIAEAFRPANAAAIAHVCPLSQRPRGYALQRLAINLGVTIGPAIGGFLAVLGYKYIFLLNGFTAITAAVTFKYLFKNIEFVVQPVHSESTLKPPSLFQDKIFLAVQAFFLFLGFAFIQVMSTWSVYLNTVFDLPEYQVGSLLTINALIVVLFELPLIHKLETYNHLTIISIGAILLFWGFGLLPLGYGYLYAVFTVVIWSIGEMLVFPLIFSFISSRAPKEGYGRYMGMTTFTFSLTYVIGPAIGTYVYDNISATALWLGLGFLGIAVSIGFLGLNFLLKKEKSALTNQ